MHLAHNSLNHVWETGGEAITSDSGERETEMGDK